MQLQLQCCFCHCTLAYMERERCCHPVACLTGLQFLKQSTGFIHTYKSAPCSKKEVLGCRCSTR